MRNDARQEQQLFGRKRGRNGSLDELFLTITIHEREDDTNKGAIDLYHDHSTLNDAPNPPRNKTHSNLNMRTQIILLLSSIIPLISAQAAADGLIVPFSSVLPACASKCGKLFDVQGACTPPNIAATSSSCFCADPRLTPLLNQGTASVVSVCTAATGECTDTADLEAIQNWYASYCNEKSPNPTTTSGGSTATGTGTTTGTSKPVSTGPAKPQSW